MYVLSIFVPLEYIPAFGLQEGLVYGWCRFGELGNKLEHERSAVIAVHL